MKRLSPDVQKFIKDDRVKEYIADSQWDKLWDLARWDNANNSCLEFVDIAELYDLLIESKIPCPEPPESQMIHKYLGTTGILNENVEYRAEDEGDTYEQLIPYVGRPVQVLDLDEAELFDEDEKVDDNFTWCFWKVWVRGVNSPIVISGDCIDFPNLGIEQPRLR